MGMDVYVGPLSRYLARDWQTIVEQAGEASGRPVQVLRPDGGEPPSPVEALEASRRFQHQVAEQIGRDDIGWPDDPSWPYATDKPDWDGYAGLLLLAAYDERPHLDPRRASPPRPADSVKRFTEAPAYVAAEDERPLRYSTLLHHVEWWLPIPDDVHIFVTARPSGEEARVGSVEMLHLELDVLRKRYGLTEEHLAGIRRHGPPHDEDPWNWGRFGLACLLPLVGWAREARHPVLLDY